MARTFTIKSKACYFRAAGSRFRLPLWGGKYTIEAWVKPKKGNKDGGFVGWGAYGKPNGANGFRQWGNKGLVNYWWKNDLGRKGIDVQGKWHHVAATFDGRIRRIFLDFKQVAARSSRGYNVATKKNFCVGKTYGKEYFQGSMRAVQIWNFARGGGMLKAGRTTPVLWMRGERRFTKHRCIGRSAGRKAALPMGNSPFTLEAWILPSRRGHFNGGIVGWGRYGKRNAVNAFRLAGRDGIFAYWWANDLYASGNTVRRNGRRVHDGRWHHVATTFDGWFQRMYVDFKLVAARKVGGPKRLKYKGNFCVGKTFGREYFRGRIRNLKIYTYERNHDEMKKKGC